MKTVSGLVVLALATSACSLFTPQRDPSRFYTLTALGSDDARQDPPGPPVRDGLVLGVGPVTLPGYLRRLELVTRVGPNQVAFSDVARWGEPLEYDVARVLAQDLVWLLSPDQVVTFPGFGATLPSMTVAIDVQQFERTSDGAARLAARWVVRDGPSRTVLVARETVLSEQSPSDDAGSVAALSGMLSGLGREIAGAIRSLPPPAAKKKR